MTTISITPEKTSNGDLSYRAVAGAVQSAGRTPGEALDALNVQLDQSEAGTLVVVQQMRPDEFFSKSQQDRLAELMTRWRGARDSGGNFPSEEQAELDSLVKAELKAATDRAAALVRELNP